MAIKMTKSVSLEAEMSGSWHPDQDLTPTPREVENMALVLEARHGRLAAEVADFFADLHSLGGDAGRSWAWSGVAELIRRMEEKRQTDF